MAIRQTAKEVEGLMNIRIPGKLTKLEITGMWSGGLDAGNDNEKACRTNES